jgi:hypothetical protein
MSLGYGFIEFDSHERAKYSLDSLAGQPVPSAPGKAFKLKWAERRVSLVVILFYFSILHSSKYKALNVFAVIFRGRERGRRFNQLVMIFRFSLETWLHTSMKKRLHMLSSQS